MLILPLFSLASFADIFCAMTQIPDLQLKLTNSLTRQKEVFEPLDPENVRMYVCGPTVYDDAHIGNARPVVVFDLLFRLLRHLYGDNHVTYVRNITDVDDKINNRAREEGITIKALTERTIAQFHKDIAALGCLPPSVEPRATDHIDAMKTMIENLVSKNHAYVAEHHVLFDVTSMPSYGKLSNRHLEDMIAGSRVEVAPYKKNPHDFVLWKPSGEDEPGWLSPCGIEGKGRPGWHIECSAMAGQHLGSVFDIHGGGVDLTFPHHENEIAQSCCAHGTNLMARMWVHNGFLKVNGRKMSKSEGNFITMRQLLETDEFGGRRWPGEVIRLALLMTHYTQPLDFNLARLEEAQTLIRKIEELYFHVKISIAGFSHLISVGRSELYRDEIISHLCNDLDMNPIIQKLYSFNKNNDPLEAGFYIYECARILNLFNFKRKYPNLNLEFYNIESQFYRDQRDHFERLRNSAGTIIARNKEQYKNEKIAINASEEELSQLAGMPCKINDSTNTLFFLFKKEKEKIEEALAKRLDFINQKNWAEADRIREELAAEGIQLSDSKNPQTGERETQWSLV
jgi:cysteinyl-tRNA synthetase